MYVQTAFILVNCLLACYYCWLICRVRRPDVQVSSFVYAFPIITSLYFGLQIIQIAVADFKHLSLILWALVSLSPGISYAVLFIGIVLRENR